MLVKIALYFFVLHYYQIFYHLYQYLYKINNYVLYFELKESFLKSGGERFDTIPCLNDNEDHIKLLVHLINKSIRK